MRVETTQSLPLPDAAQPRRSPVEATRNGPPPATRAAAAIGEGIRAVAAARPQPQAAPQTASARAEAVASGEVEMQVEERLNELLADSLDVNRRLRVHRDETSDRFVYQSVDRRTGEVVTQFPPESLIKVIAAIRRAEGLLLDREA